MENKASKPRHLLSALRYQNTTPLKQQSIRLCTRHCEPVASENLLPPDATEQSSQHVCSDHLKLDNAKLKAEDYVNSITTQSNCTAILANLISSPQGNEPMSCRPLSQVWQYSGAGKFPLQVQSLVGLLQTQDRKRVLNRA